MLGIEKRFDASAFLLSILHGLSVSVFHLSLIVLLVFLGNVSHDFGGLSLIYSYL